MKKLLILLIVVTGTKSVVAQTATFTTPTLEASFKGDAAKSDTGDNPTVLVITSPSKLEMKSRGVARLNTEIIDLEGKVLDNDGIETLLVNKFAVSVNSDGTFRTELRMKKGANMINFQVVDALGNVFSKNYNVEIESPSEIIPVSNEVVGKYYALLIGINEYMDPDMNDLDRPIADAESLGKILTEQYIFDEENVTYLRDATRADIINSLDDLSKKVTEQDNVLIFYAGHGLWDQQRNIGYWIPSDGKRGNTVDYFRNSTLTELINGIPSKHTLLVADACFSGAIFKTRKAFYDADAAINKLYEFQSRKAMTSGTLEEVPDRSVFLYYLKKRLEGNSEKYLSAASLFNSFRTAVINNANDLVPQYGTIQNVGDEGGEFIFIRRDQ